MKSILSPTFRYTPSAQTDLRKTFARVRREMQARQFGAAREETAMNVKVTPIRTAKNRSG